MNIERARRLVRQYTAAKTSEEAEPIAQRMILHNECVWHALAMVSGKPCRCSDCTG